MFTYVTRLRHSGGIFEARLAKAQQRYSTSRRESDSLLGLGTLSLRSSLLFRPDAVPPFPCGSRTTSPAVMSTDRDQNRLFRKDDRYEYKRLAFPHRL